MLRHSNRRSARAVAVMVVAVVVTSAGAVLAPTPAGAVPVIGSFSYTGPPVAIPDGPGFATPGAPAEAEVAASGLLGPITDIDLRIDGSSCNAVAGSTTVGLDHTFVSDLQISLTSPEGTTVNAVAFSLGSNNGQDGNNFCQTVFDDEAAVAFSGEAGTHAPFTGSFTPASPLSAFDGEDGNGTWTLTVRDFQAEDTGHIRAFSVLVTTDPVITATKTVSGTFEEGGTVIYTITATNHTGVASGNNLGHEITDILPDGLTFVTADATSGNTLGFSHVTRTLFWNGSFPANGSVTVTMTATVDAGMANQTIVNQADFNYDADTNGSNESSGVSDDPAVVGLDDPTSFTVAAVPPPIPPPGPSDGEQYVDGVYQALLARPADASGSAFWSGQLAGGLARADFTRAVEGSGEGTDTQVARSYLALLDRAVDPAGVAAWHAFLAGGGTTRLLEAQLAGSAEFFSGAGGTNAGFVAEAYRELLGREVDGAGAAFWQNTLAAGTSRTAVAQALLDSDEGVAHQLAGAYQLVLHRAPDPAGAAFWAPIVRSGDRRSVLASLAASDEFFTLATIG